MIVLVSVSVDECSFECLAVHTHLGGGVCIVECVARVSACNVSAPDVHTWRCPGGRNTNYHCYIAVFIFHNYQHFHKSTNCTLGEGGK